MGKFVRCDLRDDQSTLGSAPTKPHDPKCYRCAVEAVIHALGFDAGCACLSEGKKLCGNALCGTLPAHWRRALDATKRPHLPLMDDHIATLGTRLEKVVVESEDGQRIELSPHELANFDFPTGATVAHIFDHDIEQAARDLAETVHSNPISHYAAKRLVARVLREGGSAPAALREWVSDYLEERISSPTAAAKTTGTTRDRDILIVELVETLKDEAGLPATSGSADRGHSACNAVAQAFQHLGIPGMGYETVAKAWKSRRKLWDVEFPPRG